MSHGLSTLQKSAGLQVCRSAGLQVCRSASLQVCKSASLQVCKSASLQVCKSASLQSASVAHRLLFKNFRGTPLSKTRGSTSPGPSKYLLKKLIIYNRHPAVKGSGQKLLKNKSSYISCITGIMQCVLSMKVESRGTLALHERTALILLKNEREKKINAPLMKILSHQLDEENTMLATQIYTLQVGQNSFKNSKRAAPEIVS